MATFLMIIKKVMDASSTATQIITSAIGRIIDPMAKASTPMLTDPITTVSGRTTSIMVLVKKCGLTAPYSKDTTKKGRNMGAADLSGLMAVHLKEISLITRWKVMAPMYGTTAVNTLDSGRTISNMARGTSYGKTVESIRVNMFVTNVRDMVFLLGLTAVSITEVGCKVASTASLSTKKLMAKSSVVSGIMASV